MGFQTKGARRSEPLVEPVEKIEILWKARPAGKAGISQLLNSVRFTPLSAGPRQRTQIRAIGGKTTPKYPRSALTNHGIQHWRQPLVIPEPSQGLQVHKGCEAAAFSGRKGYVWRFVTSEGMQVNNGYEAAAFSGRKGSRMALCNKGTASAGPNMRKKTDGASAPATPDPRLELCEKDDLSQLSFQKPAGEAKNDTRNPRNVSRSFGSTTAACPDDRATFPTPRPFHVEQYLPNGPSG